MTHPKLRLTATSWCTVARVGARQLLLGSGRSSLLVLGILLVCLDWAGEVFAAERSIQAVTTEETIVLDGVLKEQAWRLAPPIRDFTQAEPQQGDPSTEQTEVRVLYDSDFLYFGVRCFDREPEKIVANSLTRDFLPKDEDSFEILLDTFSDSRNGYLFVTNPNAAKRDLQFTGEGKLLNVSWDAIWDVKTSIDSQGWTAEVKIPFKSLRYGSQKSWNINFGRRIRRNNEIAYWTPVPRQYDITRVSLAGELLGLETTELKAGRNLYIKPFFTGLIKNEDSDTSSRVEVGGDVKYGLSPGLTLDLTVNTDFSQIEVDEQQVNLTRFSLFFPEKRDFFLENQGLFEVGAVGKEPSSLDPEDVILFYSRRIGLSDNRRVVPILGGARLTGRLGAYQLGFMNLETGEAHDQGRENDTVLRVKRDLLERSEVGFLFLNRQGSERLTNRTFGIDGVYRPRSDLTFNGLFANTQTPGIQGDDWAMRVDGEFNRSWLKAGLIHTSIQDDYQNDLGFAARTGVRVTRLEITPRIRPWQGRAIREIAPLFNIRYITDQEERLLTRKVTTGVTVPFQNGGQLVIYYRKFFERLDEEFEIHPDVIIDQGDYNFTNWEVNFSSDPSRALSGQLRWAQGEFWDGRQRGFRLGGQYRPKASLSMQLKFAREVVDLPAGKFKVDLVGLRFHYAWNTKTFLDALVQYNQKAHIVLSNVRFNLIHHALSDLFLVYTEERPTLGATETDRAIALKYTHLLGL